MPAFLPFKGDPPGIVAAAQKLQHLAGWNRALSLKAVTDFATLVSNRVLQVNMPGVPSDFLIGVGQGFGEKAMGVMHVPQHADLWMLNRLDYGEQVLRLGEIAVRFEQHRKTRPFGVLSQREQTTGYLRKNRFPRPAVRDTIAKYAETGSFQHDRQVDMTFPLVNVFFQSIKPIKTARSIQAGNGQTALAQFAFRRRQPTTRKGCSPCQIHLALDAAQLDALKIGRA